MATPNRLASVFLVFMDLYTEQCSSLRDASLQKIGVVFSILCDLWVDSMSETEQAQPTKQPEGEGESQRWKGLPQASWSLGTNYGGSALSSQTWTCRPPSIPAILTAKRKTPSNKNKKYNDNDKKPCTTQQANHSKLTAYP